MKALLTLVLAALIAVGVYWFIAAKPDQDRELATRETMNERVERIGEAVEEKVERWPLETEDIREELRRTGEVVREKTRELGSALADAVADGTITASIKTKLAADPDLSAMKISVDTTDGVVTLAGTVGSHEEVRDAMALALAQDGVRKVISKLQVETAVSQR